MQPSYILSTLRDIWMHLPSKSLQESEREPSRCNPPIYCTTLRDIWKHLPSKSLQESEREPSRSNPPIYCTTLKDIWMPSQLLYFRCSIVFSVSSIEKLPSQEHPDQFSCKRASIQHIRARSLRACPNPFQFQKSVIFQTRFPS